MRSPTEVVVSAQVKAFAARLHPEHRRALKSALRELAHGRGAVKKLEDELDGIFRLEVGKYRVAYRYGPRGEIRCFFMETRRMIYDVLRANLDRLLAEE